MAQMGRPRNFDRDEAVQQAMQLFWQHGYESTSLSMLKAGIGGGITAPSFYAAFGSKEQLFGEVVARYVASHGQVTASLWDEQLSPREAIERVLRRSAEMQTESTHPQGCLLVLAAATCAPEHQSVLQLLAHHRQRTRTGFTDCVQRALDAGELKPETDAQAFAATFHSFLFGLSFQARDGVPVAALNSAITYQMTVWDRAAVN